MKRLKCPYCPETRPTHAHLVRHVDVVHKAVSVTRRTLDLRNPQTVEDVTVTGPELAEPMPTKADRESLDAALARTGAGLAEAGREMAEMRATLDAVDKRMQKLDAQLTSPATVRRATLNQVWYRLIDAGDLTGAAIVMMMINAVVDN